LPLLPQLAQAAPIAPQSDIVGWVTQAWVAESQQPSVQLL